MWAKLLPALHTPGVTLVTRVNREKLLAAGMPTEEIDKLLSQSVGDYNKVSLPTVLRGTPQPLGLGEGKPLTRQMSNRALAKNLPKDTVGDSRCFFRTWVRAVKVNET